MADHGNAAQEYFMDYILRLARRGTEGVGGPLGDFSWNMTTMLLVYSSVI